MHVISRALKVRDEIMRKRTALCYAVVVTAGGLAAWYITSQNKLNRTRLPVQVNDAGTIHLSAHCLERMIMQLLSAFSNVRPQHVRAHFSEGKLSEIQVTMRVQNRRFQTPSTSVLQRYIHTKIKDWAGIDLPTSVLKIETIR